LFFFRDTAVGHGGGGGGELRCLFCGGVAGSLLSGGGSVPRKQATAAEWVSMVSDFQKGSLSTRLGIPMIYGIDAVHGHNNVYGATIFPHNVALGATRQAALLSPRFAKLLPFFTNREIRFCLMFLSRDPNLVKRIGAATALEVRATGIQYAFAPCIAVGHHQPQC
jgi:beta-glucosidase